MTPNPIAQDREYCPQIAASYAARQQAERARLNLLDRGVALDSVELIEPEAPERSLRVLRGLVLAALAGAATGAVLATLIQLGLLAAFPALLDAGMWVTLPAALWCGAALGLLGGAALGAGQGGLDRTVALVKRLSGHPRFMLIARPRNVREAFLARAALRESLH
jgi:hypothetical protein